MKLIFTVFLSIFLIPSYSQPQTSEESIPVLTQKIIAHQTTERGKVTAIFRWITDNISYRVPNCFNRTWPNLKKANEDIDDTSTVLKPLNERVAELVLKRKSAVCDGYARLFKTLCDYAGIKSEVVSGYSKTGFQRAGEKFRSNHTWNAVCIDSAWYLLDATWASGYITWQGDDFIRSYNDHYFLTPPQQFIYDHYPEDLKWTLLPSPPELREYYSSPFKPQGFIRRRILSYKPEKGVIDAFVGDTIAIELQTDDTVALSPDPYFDSVITSQPGSWAFVKPASPVNGKTISYIYPVQLGDTKWLHIVYNDEVVMRYKLNIISKPVEVQPEAVKNVAASGLQSDEPAKSAVNLLTLPQ